MSLFSSIKKYILPHIRKYIWVFWSVIICFSLRVIFGGILTTIVFKKIIDALSTNTDKALLAHQLWVLVFWMIIVNLLSTLFARLGSYLHGVHFEANVVR